MPVSHQERPLCLGDGTPFRGPSGVLRGAPRPTPSPTAAPPLRGGRGHCPVCRPRLEGPCSTWAGRPEAGARREGSGCGSALPAGPARGCNQVARGAVGTEGAAPPRPFHNAGDGKWVRRGRGGSGVCTRLPVCVGTGPPGRSPDVRFQRGSFPGAGQLGHTGWRALRPENQQTLRPPAPWHSAGSSRSPS